MCDSDRCSDRKRDVTCLLIGLVLVRARGDAVIE